MERSRKMMTWITGRTGVNREDMLVCMEHAGIYLLTFQCLFEEDGIAYTMVSPLHLKKSFIHTCNFDAFDNAREYACFVG